MSYDLFAFEAEAAPREAQAFLAWYREQTTWADGQSYNDPTVTTRRLHAWYDEMKLRFPPLNGPEAAEDPEAATVTDYSFGRQFIYAGFPWPAAELAAEAAAEAARRHGVGLFLASNGGPVTYPAG